MSFDSLLVANRGEIAVRILRSARALGLRTVAIYSDADRGTPHVGMADAAVRVGPAPAGESYLRADAIVAAALEHGAGAVHPGYGLLSESADFAEMVQSAGLTFVGPTPEQLRAFGAKDRARELARAAGVPLIDGTDLLANLEAALAAAEEIGYPVMLKASAGGGGIGMARCHDAPELTAAFESVQRTARASFGSGGVFLERLVTAARHVEVQLFGNGEGAVIALGDRDCTLQRRNQKVIEEAPAPELPDAVRTRIADSAVALLRTVAYRSAGTAEFAYDAETETASFLEVNARLQVEHPVTEARFGIDLVAAMLRQARGDRGVLEELGAARPAGCAVEARLYAENPNADHAPSPGLLTEVAFPDQLRVDSWVDAGTEVTPAYDPLLAKLIACGDDREQALDRLAEGLVQTRIGGIETNLGLLRAAVADERVRTVTHTTATLAAIADPRPRIDVVRPGMMTTVQDWPGRLGLWHVGVPPSGAMDDRSLRLGNRALGNPEGAAGLECTVEGPAVRFSHETVVCVTGARCTVTVDGQTSAMWEPITVPAGAMLDLGAAEGPGLRTYLCVAGGLDVPEHLGSAATFTLAGFGGHGGRALRAGDVLPVGEWPATAQCLFEVIMTNKSAHWAAGKWGVAAAPVARPGEPLVVRALPGPEYAQFAPASQRAFWAEKFTVTTEADRMGCRLSGPALERNTNTELLSSAVTFGTVQVPAGGQPIVLLADCQTTGGYPRLAQVIAADRGQLAQALPGARLRFRLVAMAEAQALYLAQERRLRDLARAVYLKGVGG